jgi:hypothetical protein
MNPGARTIQGELYNWLEDYVPTDLLDKCAKALEEVVTENSLEADTQGTDLQSLDSGATTPAGGGAKDEQTETDELDNILEQFQSSTIIIDSQGSVLGPKEDARAFMQSRQDTKAALEAWSRQQTALARLDELEAMQREWYANARGELEERPDPEDDWLGADLYDRIAALRVGLEGRK